MNRSINLNISDEDDGKRRKQEEAKGKPFRPGNENGKFQKR
jgi:hypothetical protein